MSSIGIVAIYLVMQMILMWGFYRILKNPSVVDVSWSLGLMISGLIYLSTTVLTGRILTIGILLTLWALRLAFYLWFTRIRQGHVDPRYKELSSHWKISPSLGFFLNFQLQGLLIFIISSVFLLISQSELTHMTPIDRVAFGVIIVGILGESLADFQLQRFKHQYQGQVCNVGLWRYSRHPNYFFDWMSWMGFALLGLQSPMGIFSVLSPWLLYVIFTRITGPLTERGSVKSRGQKYIDYQKQTSMFFPWVQRKL